MAPKASEQLARLDGDEALRERLRPLCRLEPGDVWVDDRTGHRVGVCDAADREALGRLHRGLPPVRLAIQDPPYNVAVGQRATAQLSRRALHDYLRFSRAWLESCLSFLDRDAHLYLWAGSDPKAGFAPLPDLMLLLRELPGLRPRSLITLRNQRGYGTQKNWMWVRQELLHYSLGDPPFQVTYTDVPKKVSGYYKQIGGRRTENRERGRADTIRPGNVWTDIQQVFYRREENVPGCYAQKPLAAFERIVASSSREGEPVSDYFLHSGTTLLAAERLGRIAVVSDVDPIYAEISIRRLERYRQTGALGWQWHHPFPELNEGR